MTVKPLSRLGVVVATLAAASAFGLPSAFAAPTVTVTAAPGPFDVGDKITVSTSVGSGVDTPATFTIRLFQNGDCSGAPIAVGAPKDMTSGGGGPYTFGLANANAGTYTFSGTLDQDSGAHIVRCSSSVLVRQHTPNLSVSATSAAPGDPIRAIATLSNRVKTPQNPPPVSMSFKAYAPADPTCTDAPVFTSAKQVYTENQSYTSTNFSPDDPGTYRWKITYSGDGNNASVTSGCGVATSVLTSGGTPPPPSTTPTCGGAPATIVGTGKGETIIGTTGNDVIVARGGADVVNGKGGRDLICGGSGKDILRGGNGNDVIRGGRGNDKLYGGPGSDGLNGGKGTDFGSGGPGTDVARSIEKTD